MTRTEELKLENLLLLMSKQDIEKLDADFKSMQPSAPMKAAKAASEVVESAPDDFEDALGSLDLSSDNSDFGNADFL